MYNQKVIDRLKNLTYLSSLSKKNISMMSKPNDFGDVVKFMAQINKEDVIQKIRFKATGCSHFVALCSYFCEIIEGKKVADALKVKEKDLIKFDVLEESKCHVYPIILNTFALMIKKYRKGVEKGLIVPCEVEESVVEQKVAIKKQKNIDVTEGLDEILVSKKTKKVVTVENKTVETTTTIVDQKHEVKEQSSDVRVEKKASKKVSKRDTVVEDSKKEIVSNSNIESKNETINIKNIEIKEEINDISKVKVKKENKKESKKETNVNIDKKSKKESKKKAKITNDDVEIIVEEDNSNIDTEVVVNDSANLVVVEDAVVESTPKAKVHTKVEHKKTVTRQKFVKKDDEVHADVSVEHEEIKLEHVSDEPVKVEKIHETIELNDVKIDNAQDVNEKVLTYSEPDSPIKENKSLNDKKAERLKNIQMGLSNTQAKNKEIKQENKASNLNSMLAKLNSNNNVKGATVVTTTTKKRVEYTKKTDSYEKIESEKKSENLTSMRNSILNLRKQNNVENKAIEEKIEVKEKKEAKKEKAPKKVAVEVKKEKDSKKQKSKKDDVEVVYLDEESKKSEKKGFFSRLFRK